MQDGRGLNSVGAALRNYVARSAWLSRVMRLRFLAFRFMPGLHGFWYRHVSPLFHPEWKLRPDADSSVKPLPWGEHVLLVSHFADGTGGPMLLLNIARGFRAAGFNPHVVLLRDGPLREEFARHGSVDVALDEKDMSAVLERLKPYGMARVFLNTTVSGAYAEFFKARGMYVVTLVHELIGVVKAMGLCEAARSLQDASDRIIVPSSLVADSWRDAGLPFPPDKTRVMPQPDFTEDLGPLHGQERISARERLRGQWGLPPDARIVVGCGQLEERKGPDVFFQVAERVCRECDNVFFFWVGDRGAEDYRRAILEIAAKTAGRSAIVGYQDLKPILQGADVFLLPSRQDPFPLVALMAARCALPVVHCRATTGIRDVFGEIPKCGVPACTVDDFADAMLALLAEAGGFERAGEACLAAYSRSLPSFRDYVAELYGMTDSRPLPVISCVIPNYNYARFLERRIACVMEQTYRVSELVILDDNSSDESASVIPELVEKYKSRFPMGIQYVRNDRNAGVFRQWVRGAEMSHGDCVWIAEADDECSPLLMSRLVHAFRRNADVRIAYAQSSLMDEHGETYQDTFLSHTDSISAGLWRNAWVMPGLTLLESGLAVRNVIPNASGALFARDSLMTLPDEVFSYRSDGDWFAYVAMLRQGSVAFCPEPLNHYRRHRGSVIASNLQRVTDEMFRIHSWILSWARLSPYTQSRMREEYEINCRELHTERIGEYPKTGEASKVVCLVADAESVAGHELCLEIFSSLLRRKCIVPDVLFLLSMRGHEFPVDWLAGLKHVTHIAYEEDVVALGGWKAFLCRTQTSVALSEKEGDVCERFDAVVSLGWNCETAYSLLRYFGALESYPLNWANVHDSAQLALFLTDPDLLLAKGVRYIPDHGMWESAALGFWLHGKAQRRELQDRRGNLDEARLAADRNDLMLRQAHLIDKFKRLCADERRRVLFVWTVRGCESRDGFDKVRDALAKRSRTGVLLAIFDGQNLPPWYGEIEEDPHLIVRKLGFLARPDHAVDPAWQDVDGWNRVLSGIKAHAKAKNKVYKFQKGETLR